MREERDDHQEREGETTVLVREEGQKKATGR